MGYKRDNERYEELLEDIFYNINLYPIEKMKKNDFINREKTRWGDLVSANAPGNGFNKKLTKLLEAQEPELPKVKKAVEKPFADEPIAGSDEKKTPMVPAKKVKKKEAPIVPIKEADEIEAPIIPIKEVVADTSGINADDIKSKVAGLLANLPKAVGKPGLDFSEPKAVVDSLDEWVTGQDAAKRVLALAFSDYMASSIVTPVLLIGGSGCGKTYMTDLLCREANIPYVKISLANVTTEGYKGRNLTESLEGLVGKERGVIFLDEFDKLVSTDSNNPGFGPKLQKELLAIFTGEKIKISGINSSKSGQMENDKDENEEPVFKGTVVLYYLRRNRSSDEVRKLMDAKSILYEEVDSATLNERTETDSKILSVSRGKDPVVKIDGKLVNASDLDDVLEGLGLKKIKDGKKVKNMSVAANVVDTGKFMIVCAGAFAGSYNAPSIQEIIQGRLGGNVCKLKKEALLENITDEDLINYGLMPEIVGRIRCKAVLQPQDADGLLMILKQNKGSPYQQIVERFKSYGIELEIEEPALKEIADLALAGVGVRALGSVLDRLVGKYSFERTTYKGKKITITPEEVEKEFKIEARFAEVDDFNVNWQEPNSIMKYLGIYVSKQEDAKKALAKAFCLYSSRIRSKEPQRIPSANVLVIGPTGCGKTYSIELLAKKARMPITKVNLGNFNETLEDALRNFPKGQKNGIIYVDEADKVLMNPGDPRNKSFIGYLENGVYNGIDLSGMLFILSGAFQPLFDAKNRNDPSATMLTREDLENYGIQKEILGRLPIIANIMPMTIETLVGILQSPKSAVADFAHFFKAERDISIKVDESAYQVIAEEAIKTSQGARALKGVCDKLFDWYFFNAESGKSYVIGQEKAKEILRGK